MEQLTFEDLPQAVSNLQQVVLNIERLLLQKSAESKPEDDQLLTIKQASYYLKLSVKTVYGYVQRAEIPVYKKGKRLYFMKKDLVAWVQEGRKKTMEEIQEETSSFIKRKGGKNGQ